MIAESDRIHVPARWALCLAVAILCVVPGPVRSVAPDTCAQQRKLFPTNWMRTVGERTVVTCYGKYVRPRFRVRRPSRTGARLISMTVGSGRRRRVFRTIVSAATHRRLRQGAPVRLLLRSERSCFIRGHTSHTVFVEISKKGGFLLVNSAHDLLNSCEYK